MAAVIPFSFHSSNNSSGKSVGSRPTIIFTHHYGGSQKTLKRHVQAVNDLGFNAVTFDFSWHGLKPRRIFALNFHQSWVHDLESVVNQVQGPKIIFAFSGPGSATLDLTAKLLEQNRKDIVGLIFDSGPFVSLWVCVGNLLREYYEVKTAWKQKVYLPGMVAIWGFRHTHRILSNSKTIFKLRPNFPILSFRGEKDSLVPEAQVDKIFSPFDFTDLRVVRIGNCGHLTGLKEHPEIYVKELKNFLSKFS